MPPAEQRRTGASAGAWQRALSAVLGGLALVVGVVLTLRPFSSLRVLVVTIVVGLVVTAAADLLEGSAAGGGRRLRALLGAGVRVALALGLLLWPGAGLGVIVVLAALSLAGNGVLDVVAGALTRGARRWTLLFLGTASVLVAVLAFAWPDVALLVIAAAFGVRLVVFGGNTLARALRPGRGNRPPRPRPQLTISALGLLGALLLVGVSLVLGRAFPEPGAFYAAPDELPAEPGRLLRSEPFDRGVPEGARAWRILYTTTAEDGATTVASGVVVAPGDERSRGGAPLVAWAHGTTGWAPKCAPSLLEEPFESGALFVLGEVASEGWSLVMPDYVGLGTQGPHPYLVGAPTARSVLDSVRAARKLLGGGAADPTVVWGHSQGGHAALWTGMLAPDYAPELRIGGVAALAPASNLPALVEVVGSVRGGSLFAAYVAQAYTDVYDDVGFERYVRPGARLLLREMAQRCLSEPSTVVSFAGSLLLQEPVWREEPASGPLAERLQENVPSAPIAAPLLLMQGEADALVTPEAQRAYVSARCASGDEVDYRTYEGRGHVELVTADSPAIAELFAWTRARFAGAEPAPAGCEPP